MYLGVSYRKGHGIGNFLGGLFRRVLPLLKQGFRNLGTEASKTGTFIANDVVNNAMPMKKAFKSRVRESRKQLKRKAKIKLVTLIIGIGYNYGKIAGMYQSGLIPAEGSIYSIKKKPLKKTIKKNKYRKIR